MLLLLNIYQLGNSSKLLDQLILDIYQLYILYMKKHLHPNKFLLHKLNNYHFQLPNICLLHILYILMLQLHYNILLYNFDKQMFLELQHKYLLYIENKLHLKIHNQLYMIYIFLLF